MEAFVTTIEAQMGQGKTTTATAFAVDSYKRNGTKIYANYHLYGIPYVFFTMRELMTWLNYNIISDGILIIDESYIEADARRGMNPVTMLMTWFGQQTRKRKLEVFIIVQNNKFLDWRLRWITARKILCKYNKNTYRVSLLIQDLINGKEYRRSFYAPQYWKYYNTNELPVVPDKYIAKARAWA